jgi:hypothetical protein
MCRNIRVLLNFEPPATEEEMRAAALQYVRKVSGTRSPSASNQERFDHAVEAITQITRDLIETMEVRAPPKHREAEIAKAKARSIKRFGVRREDVHHHPIASHRPGPTAAQGSGPAPVPGAPRRGGTG